MEVSGRRTDGASGGLPFAGEGELFCQPCRSDGDMVVAVGYCQNCNEYLCVTCLKVHRKQSMSRNHVILDGKSMPKSLASEIEVESCSEICAKHTNEIVKFFCSAHDIIGCGDCMILEHKVCKVERIQDISTTYLNGPEHTRLVETVEKVLQNLVDIGACIQLAEVDMNAIYMKALGDIKSFRKEVNNYLDKAEAEIRDEIERRKKEISKTISGLEIDKISLKTDIKALEEKLQLQSNKANELFVAAKQTKYKMTAIDVNIKQMFQNCQTQSYTFEPSSDLNKMVSSKSPLGKLTEQVIKRNYEPITESTTDLGQPVSSKVPLGKLTEQLEQRNPQRKLKVVDMKPQFDGEVTIKTQEDKSDCFIIASALISPSQIILADNTNKCLKIVDIEQRKVSSRHELRSSPVDATVVSRNLIAVTLPDKQKIQLLSVTKKNTLIESHHINVNGNVRKITCQNDKLIIGYTDKIEILKMNGDVVKTISSTDFTLIQGIAFSHDSMAFYVSNDSYYSKNLTAVYKFDFDGNVLATYKDKTLSGIRGLTVAPDGTVLVCYWSGNCSIHMISPTCKKIKEILKQNVHVQYPYSVSFCCQTNRLFLSNYSTGLEPELKNVLKIFRIM